MIKLLIILAFNIFGGIMYIITFKLEGRVFQRRITRKQGFYVMESKGVEYWFGKDLAKSKSTQGWHIVNGKILPDDFIKLLSVELEKLYLANQTVYK